MIKNFISRIDFVTYINNKKAIYFDVKYLSLTKKFIEKILSRYIIQFIKKKRERFIIQLKNNYQSYVHAESLSPLLNTIPCKFRDKPNLL